MLRQPRFERQAWTIGRPPITGGRLFLFTVRYDVTCDRCGEADEIEKPMSAPLPACSACGGPLRQVYRVPAIHYAAAGFHSTDYTRFEKQVGPERAARFRAQKADAEARAKVGRLTEYEKALETI